MMVEQKEEAKPGEAIKIEISVYPRPEANLPRKLAGPAVRHLLPNASKKRLLLTIFYDSNFWKEWALCQCFSAAHQKMKDPRARCQRLFSLSSALADG